MKTNLTILYLACKTNVKLRKSKVSEKLTVTFGLILSYGRRNIVTPQLYDLPSNYFLFYIDVNSFIDLIRTKVNF